MRIARNLSVNTFVFVYSDDVVVFWWVFDFDFQSRVNIGQFSSYLGITDGTPVSPEAKTQSPTQKEAKAKNTKAKTKKRTKQRHFTDKSHNSHSHPHPGQQHHQEQHNTMNNSTANDVASVATQIALMDPPSIYISSDGEHGDVHPNCNLNPNLYHNNSNKNNKHKNSHLHHHHHHQQQAQQPQSHPHPQYPIFTTIDHVSVPPIPEANSYNVLKKKGKDNDHNNNNNDSSRESTPRRSKKKYRVELSPRLSASSREQSVTSLNSNISLNTAATMEDNEVVFTARFDDSYGGDMRTSVFVAHGAAESNNYESSDYSGAININSNSLSNKGKSKIDSSYINNKNGNFKTKKRRGKHKVYTSGSSNMFDHGGYIVEDFADMYQSNATDQD